MKIARTLLLTALVIPIASTHPTSVWAESSKTEGEVGFIENVTLPPIVNPLNPNSEIETDLEKTVGALSIDYASNLDFGNHQISTSDKTYYAAANTVTVKENGEEVVIPNFVQVTDNRGTKGGWTLSVTASDFSTESGKILTGAYITFHHANVYTPNSRGDGPIATYPVMVEEAGTPFPIMRANDGQGTATWGVYYAGTDDSTGEKAITLHVPGESTKMAESYTSTLEWNLSETPY